MTVKHSSAAFLCGLVVFPLSTQASTPPPPPQKLSGFIENKGQIVDQYGKPNQEVLYLFPGGDVTMHLHQDGLAYELKKIEGTLPNASNLFEPRSADEGVKVSYHKVELEWVGSNVQRIQPGAHSGMVYNYFTSTAPGITGVRSYTTVHYHNLYEGVDLVFSLTPQGTTKYDLVLAPGADLSAIRFRVKGATGLKLDEEGLHMGTSISPLLETIPASFVLHPGGGKEPVQVHYVALGDDTFGFASEVAIPNDAGLLIDPCSYTVRWASFYGEDESEVLLDMAVTPNDEVVFAGFCTITNNTSVVGTGVFQTLLGVFSSTSIEYDAFIGKLSSDGQNGYWTYFGGSEPDIAVGVAIQESTGNVYVCGTTASADLDINVLGAGGSIPTGYAYHALTDGFIAAFSPDLDVIYWTSLFGSDEGDNLVDIKVDNFSNDYLAVIGRVDVPLGTSFPTNSANCHSDGAVVALYELSTGVCSWLEGLALHPNQLDIDPSGQYIAVAGSVNTDPSLCTTYALHGSIYSTGVDAAVEVLDFVTGTSLSLALLTGSSGTDDDFATDVQWMEDHVVVCGYTASSDFPSTPNGWQQGFGGGATDGFAAYYENYDLSSSGNDWVTFIGDTGDDAATDLWCIPDVINGNTGVIWVGGLTDPTATLPYDCSVPSTTSNGFVLILDEIGQYQESLDPGLVPFRIEVNSQQQIVLGAWDPGNLSGLVPPGVHQQFPATNGDVFIAVLEGTGIYAMPILGGNGNAFHPVLTQNAQRTHENELVVWPNPGNGGVLNLSISLLEVGHANITVDLFDATGRLVLQYTRQGEGPGQNNFQLIPPKLSSGLYTLRVSAGSHEHRCTWAVE